MSIENDFEAASVRRKKRVLSCLVLLCLFGCQKSSPAPQAATALTQEEQETSVEVASAPLSLASGVWAPFTDKAGKPRYAIELVAEALRREGISIKSTIVGQQDLMRELEHGTFEGSEALWLSEEREKYLLYSEPYLENRLVLLGRVDADVSAKDVSELVGKRLGVVSNYAYGSEILEAKGPKLVYADSDEDNLRALLKEEVDYIVVDELLTYFLFQYEPEKAENRLKVASSPLATRSLHLALRRDKEGAEEIIRAFNRQLPQMRRDGTYHRLLNVAWIVADVDGDGQVETVASGKNLGTAPPGTGYHLSGTAPTGAPRFVVNGEVYDQWQTVPEEFKGPAVDPAGHFQPAISLVLLEF